MLKFNPLSGKFDLVADPAGSNQQIQFNNSGKFGASASFLWDNSNSRMGIPEIRALDGNGLKLYDDGGNGIFVKDGGNVGIGTTAPGGLLELGSGQLLLPSGSSSVPSIASSANSDTGVYFSSNSISITINGSTRGRWADSYVAVPNTVWFSADSSVGYRRLAADNFTIYTASTDRVTVDSSGNVGIGTTSPTAKLDVSSDILRLRTAKTPATAGATGNQGDICWDSDFLYICIATNTWKKVAIATW